VPGMVSQEWAFVATFVQACTLGRVLVNDHIPIESARLRGIGGGSSARLSAGCRSVTGSAVALALASD
jgi:hypothetical protein